MYNVYITHTFKKEGGKSSWSLQRKTNKKEGEERSGRLVRVDIDKNGVNEQKEQTKIKRV